MARQEEHSYEFGPFRLDAAERRLLRDGQVVPLAPKAFDLLFLLVRHGGHLMEKDELLNGVWPDQFVEESNLPLNISTLRKALGEDNSARRYIETVPKRGYRFVADVRQVGMGISRQVVEQRTTDTITLADKVGAQSQAIDSLAVLPFVNVSADPGTEYLSDGITESIINSLSQLSKLRVMARSTVFRYKGRECDPQGVGQELNVQAVLLGRVLQFGERLIIRAELVDVVDGTQLWGEQYNRAPADILAVQEEVAREISEKLRLKLTEKEQRLLTKRYTENTEAYHLYLRGRYYWNMRTPGDLNRGLEYFEEAIKTDPLYAPAHAGVADCYANMGYLFGRVPPTEAMPKAKGAARRALEIDPTLAEAYTSLASVNFLYEWDPASAKEHFERSLELNSNYPTTRHLYGTFLSTVWGRHDDAIAEASKALDLDPLSLPINHIVGFLHLLARRPDDAITKFRRTLELAPDHALVRHNMGSAFEYQGMYGEAVEEFLRGNPFVSQSEDDVKEMRRAFKRAGWKGYLRKHLALCLAQWERNGQWHGSAYYIASNYARLGDRENALAWLERAYEMRSGLLVWVGVHFNFDGLRPDPRFADLQRRVGVAHSIASN